MGDEGIPVMFIRATARVADGPLGLVSAPDEQIWRSRHGLSQADGQEADAHLTCSLKQLLNRSGSTMRIAVWHHAGTSTRL
jgi:hypothetical protein